METQLSEANGGEQYESCSPVLPLEPAPSYVRQIVIFV